MANSSSFRTVIKPSQILKKLGYPHEFICGVTPSVQPHIRYGVIGGTATSALGIISCRYTYRLSGLTNNADGVAKIKTQPMKEFNPTQAKDNSVLNLNFEQNKVKSTHPEIRPIEGILGTQAPQTPIDSVTPKEDALDREFEDLTQSQALHVVSVLKARMK
jgi:hypothetical protein